MTINDGIVVAELSIGFSISCSPFDETFFDFRGPLSLADTADTVARVIS